MRVKKLAVQTAQAKKQAKPSLKQNDCFLWCSFEVLEWIGKRLIGGKSEAMVSTNSDCEFFRICTMVRTMDTTERGDEGSKRVVAISKRCFYYISRPLKTF